MKTQIFTLIILISLNLASAQILSPSESSDIRIGIDGDSPIINIISPENITYNTASILINYTIQDLTPDTTWYSINHIKNITITAPIIITLIEGNYIITIYANDSFNRINSSEVNFTIENIPKEGSNNNQGRGGGGSSRETTPQENLQEDTNKPDYQEKQNLTRPHNQTEPETLINKPEQEIKFTYPITTILLLLIILIIIFLTIKRKKKKIKTHEPKKTDE